MKSGAEALGVDRFDYQTTASLRTPSTIEATHRKLVAAGYLFAGWHGTSLAVCEKLINGEKIKPTEFSGSKRIWSGFYVFNDASRSIGYCEAKSGVLRAYVKDAEVRDIIAASGDINHILLAQDLIKDIKDGTGKYILSGPDVEDEPGHEMVLSVDLLDSVILLPSLHNVRYEFLQAALDASTDEATTADPDITKRGNHFRP